MAEVQYRAYFFGNMYLSQIQQGIQAAHVTAEMFTKHRNDDASDTLDLWGTYHKTMILLNGGYQSALDELYKKFEYYGEVFKLPYAKFNEEKDSLNGATTSVGIVLPSFVYDDIGIADAVHSSHYREAFELYLISFYDEGFVDMFGSEYLNDEYIEKIFELHKLIKQFRLA